MTLPPETFSGPTRATYCLAGQLLLAVLGGTAMGVAGAFALAAIDHDPGPMAASVEQVRASPAELARPMRFNLGADGILIAQGSIEPGTAAKLALELQTHGPTVTTLSLNSPGGSLTEAMAMAQQVRAHGLATQIADGAVCASSCPLLFAGGVERSAGPRAAIGVHQFHAQPVAGLRGSIDAMSDTQLVTARISRHLTEMGVDPAAWLHALDTPPTALYYFSSWELAEYRLTTQPSAPVVEMLGELARHLGTI